MPSSGIFAALWLLGLLAAAPALRTSERYTFAGRVRDALIVGVSIPFVLGMVHALYPIACWLALAACIAIAYRRRDPRAERDPQPPPPYLLIGALALIAWPPLVRPLLDGDSLSYHLPNAAAWVHARSLWTTDPRYWWYPPGSELFASGLFAVAGPFALGWSGFGALALLGFRMVEWARDEFAVPAWVADALAAATVTVAPIALQAATLQNDGWLAAFFLEALWTIRREPSAAVRTVALTVLLKPYGWVFAAIAATTGKAPLKVWIGGAVAIALWVLHDAALWHGAIVAPASTSSGNTWQSTIAAHGVQALALLAAVSWRASPFALLALLAALAGPLLAPENRRALGWAALAAVLAFAIMPLAYADQHPQLETGASLRYAAPAIALGALLLARPAARAPWLAGAVFIASAIFGAASVLAIFWNDSGTHIAIVIAVLAVANVVAVQALRWQWPLAAGFALAVVLATHLAARHPVDYYVDALRVDGKAPGIYGWIAKVQPSSIGGWGLRAGVVNVLAPAARAIDLPDATPCATAQQQRVALVAVAENDRPAAFNEQRLSVARACAKPVLYDDGLAVAGGSE